MENPGMRGPIENTAKRAAALAEKFEAARNRCGHEVDDALDPERSLAFPDCGR
jgi:hypothetical protein